MGFAPSNALFALRAVVLLGGLGYAAYEDWKVREVRDSLWQGMGLIGAAVGFVAFWPDPLALVMWALVSVWFLEHLFPWDVPVEQRSERLPGWIELAIYGAVLAALVGASIEYGVGGTGVPVTILAVAASILLARGLFEIGVLYGGADAKALMVAGVLVPLDTMPLWSPAAALPLLAYYPFALNLLIDAALFAVAVPIAIAIRNVAAHEFSFPRGFTGYTIPVSELPKRFVWLKDPTFDRPGADDEAEPETSAEDEALRERQAAELSKQGVQRVWVTPQLPFVIWIFAGAMAALLVGNVVFDLLTGL